MPAPPHKVYCRVLGPARVTVDGGDAPADLLWRKHLALLVYLARSPRRSRTREHLVGLLWGDRDERQARHSLSEALRVFRRVLGDARVQADVDQIRLTDDALVLDCDLFVERRKRGDWTGAAELVEGEFLEGLSVPGASEVENWLAAERAAWRVQSVEALVKTAAARLAVGDPFQAAAAAQRALKVDPVSEPAARAAMRALALAGERAAALRVAEAIARTLRDQLGTRPGPETAGLVQRIRDARVGRRLPVAPAGARPRPPLLGRGPDLAALGAAWERAKGGRGQIVLVEGEPGEGKSRLVEELVARVRLDAASVACTRAVPTDQAHAWSGIAGLLSAGVSEFPGLAGAPPVALAALGALEPELGARFPARAAALAVPQALAAALAAAALERPILLAVDDAEWLDGPTLAALPAITRDLARCPAMLVLGVVRGAPEAARFDDLRARIGRDLDGAVLRLARFDETALRALVAWALPQYTPEEVERLTRRLERDTAGIPLLAVAMVEAVAEGFRLAPDAPAWPSPKRTLLDSLPGDLPPAVVGAVCLHYRTLDAAAQQVLAAAAALGERLEPDRLAGAAGLDRATVDAALDRLEWARWLAADARGYVFAAPIVQAILLREMVTPGQARRYRQNLET